MGTLQPLHKVEAGVLDLAYFETGPADGPPVLLMHGFPYDIHAFAEVAPLPAAQLFSAIRSRSSLRCGPSLPLH